MQFSLGRFIILVSMLSVVLALSFAAPFEIGFQLLTVISLVIIPPMILVGAVQARGVRQAFFLGCLVAGTPHFILSLYYGIFFGFQTIWSDGTPLIESVEDESGGILFLQLFHLIGYAIGMLGGLSGVCAHYFIRDNKRETTPANHIGAVVEALDDDPMAKEDLTVKEERPQPIGRIVPR